MCRDFFTNTEFREQLHPLHLSAAIHPELDTQLVELLKYSLPKFPPLSEVPTVVVSPSRGTRLIHLAAHAGCVALLRFLLECNPDSIESVSPENNRTPYYAACAQGQAKAMEVIGKNYPSTVCRLTGDSAGLLVPHLIALAFFRSSPKEAASIVQTCAKHYCATLVAHLGLMPAQHHLAHVWSRRTNDGLSPEQVAESSCSETVDEMDYVGSRAAQERLATVRDSFRAAFEAAARSNGLTIPDSPSVQDDIAAVWMAYSSLKRVSALPMRGVERSTIIRSAGLMGCLFKPSGSSLLMWVCYLARPEFLVLLRRLQPRHFAPPNFWLTNSRKESATIFAVNVDSAAHPYCLVRGERGSAREMLDEMLRSYLSVSRPMPSDVAPEVMQRELSSFSDLIQNVVVRLHRPDMFDVLFTYACKRFHLANLFAPLKKVSSTTQSLPFLAQVLDSFIEADISDESLPSADFSRVETFFAVLGASLISILSRAIWLRDSCVKLVRILASRIEDSSSMVCKDTTACCDSVISDRWGVEDEESSADSGRRNCLPLRLLRRSLATFEWFFVPLPQYARDQLLSIQVDDKSMRIHLMDEDDGPIALTGLVRIYGYICAKDLPPPILNITNTNVQKHGLSMVCALETRAGSLAVNVEVPDCEPYRSPAFSVYILTSIARLSNFDGHIVLSGHSRTDRWEAFPDNLRNLKDMVSEPPSLQDQVHVDILPPPSSSAVDEIAFTSNLYTQRIFMALCLQRSLDWEDRRRFSVLYLRRGSKLQLSHIFCDPESLNDTWIQQSKTWANHARSVLQTSIGKYIDARMYAKKDFMILFTFGDEAREKSLKFLTGQLGSALHKCTIPPSTQKLHLQDTEGWMMVATRRGAKALSGTGERL